MSEFCISSKTELPFLQPYFNVEEKRQTAPTMSLFLVIRRPIILLKKLACNGFNGSGLSRNDSSGNTRESVTRMSVIWFTSDVINSHATFEYLTKQLHSITKKPQCRSFHGPLFQKTLNSASKYLFRRGAI